MCPHNLSILFILLIISFSASISFADVEDILSSQEETKRLETVEGHEKKITPRGSEDGIQKGHKEFTTTCAVCHGKDGKGKGLFSPQLKVKPKDLTSIRSRNGGIFPFIEMYKIIDGREDTNVHGSQVMPVWGGRFSAESWFDVSTQHAETVARGKIFELLLYLESIQEN